MNKELDVYNDYQNWIKQEKDLLNKIRNSHLLERYSHIFKVLEYYYAKKDFNEEYEEDIFQTGFNYLHNNYSKVKSWMSLYYDNNFDLIVKNEKTVHLLLLVEDVLDEAEHLKGKKELENFENDIFHFLKRREEVSDYYYPLLDDIMNKVFVINNNKEFKGYVEIFYDIAEDLDLI